MEQPLPNPIKQGSDSRENWPHINHAHERLANHDRRLIHLEGDKRRVDVGGEEEILITSCATGITYAVKGRIVPPEEE